MLKIIYRFVILGGLILPSMTAFALTDQHVIIKEDAVAKINNVGVNATPENIESHEILSKNNTEETAGLQVNENSTQASILLLSLLGFIALSNRRNV